MRVHDKFLCVYFIFLTFLFSCSHKDSEKPSALKETKNGAIVFHDDDELEKRPPRPKVVQIPKKDKPL